MAKSFPGGNLGKNATGGGGIKSSDLKRQQKMLRTLTLLVNKCKSHISPMEKGKSSTQKAFLRKGDMLVQQV